MATKNCPVAGYEDFVVEYPDELLVKHQKQFARALQAAVEEYGVDNLRLDEARFYGARAICAKFEGAPDRPLDEWPLAVFRWFMGEVYDHYDAAASPKKNS